MKIRASRCCCCIRPRTGAIVLAVLGLIVYGIKLISTGMGVAQMQPTLDIIKQAREQVVAAHNDGKMSDDEYDNLIALLDAARKWLPYALWMGLFVAAMSVLTSGAMLAGILKEKRVLILPWLVFCMILIILGSAALIGLPIALAAHGMYGVAILAVVVGLLAVLLSVHFWLVVRTVYDEIGGFTEGEVLLGGFDRTM